MYLYTRKYRFPSLMVSLAAPLKFETKLQNSGEFFQCYYKFCYSYICITLDMLFKKKRTIIKELKSLFRVILDDNPNTRGLPHHRRRLHAPLLKSHRAQVSEAPAARGDVTGSSKVVGNTTLVFQGAKRGRISPSPVRQKVKGNKRVVLYRKLINDLNDLITLEISRNNKTNTFEGGKVFTIMNLQTHLSSICFC